jgi:hypothetical protein
LGLFGSGGTGGGNAVVAAALDERVKATVSQVPVADGEEWLRRMRREYEWIEFRERVRAASRSYAATGEPELVSPREDIMVPSPERKQTAVKKDVDGRVPSHVALHAAENVFRYRPIDFAAAIAPRALMLISVENDAVTPEDHARALYDAAEAPKRLLVQTGTTHYTAYAQYQDIVNPLIVEWFERYLQGGRSTCSNMPERPASAISIDPLTWSRKGRDHAVRHAHQGRHRRQRQWPRPSRYRHQGRAHRGAA